MEQISIDLETFSSVDITKCGHYRYVDSPDFEILLFAYKIDAEPTICVDLTAGEQIPFYVIDSLTNPKITKRAYNAPFEIACLSKHLGFDLPVEQWRCTRVIAGSAGWPMSLDGVAKAMKLDVQKIAEGKKLIGLFCVPCKPTKRNGGRTRNTAEHFPEKWELFKTYNITDVEVECQVLARTKWFPIPQFEHDLWVLDQQINKRGVKLDRKLFDNAVEFDKRNAESLHDEAVWLTNLDNPNSRNQLLDWLAENGVHSDTLRKTDVEDLLKIEGLPANVKRVLEIRSEASKTSIKKYYSMQQVASLKDDRARGLTQYYGASRTGRWCLAENTKVKVKNEQGISDKNIQDVLITDLVFDGDEWVEHEGVVFSGDRDVITWDGVTATKQHNVFVSTTKYTTLENAKKLKLKLWKGNSQFTK